MKYKNIIKLRLPEIQLLAFVLTQLKFSVVKDHDEPTILLFETLFCMWECFSMGTELPTKVMLGQMLVLMQITFLNSVRKVGRSVLSRTSCSQCSFNPLKPKLVQIIFKNLVRTAKETQHFTITKINWLTLFEEIISFYIENHTKPIRTKLLIVKEAGTYSYR
jgi:hypothetical protein